MLCLGYLPLQEWWICEKGGREGGLKDFVAACLGRGEESYSIAWWGVVVFALEDCSTRYCVLIGQGVY